MKTQSEGKKTAEQRDPSEPKKGRSTSDAPKGSKGANPGHRKPGDDTAANSSASGDTLKVKAPKSKPKKGTGAVAASTQVTDAGKN